MKKTLAAILLFTILSISHASDSTAIFAGMRNNRYAFAGMQAKSGFGIAFENSVLVQKVDIQYARLAVFYAKELPFNLSVNYAFYGGMRYDKEFYDFGSRISALWKVHERYLQLNAMLQPFYDSDLGDLYGYLAGFRTFILPEVALFANFKNIPEYRDVERRIEGGLLFETNHLSVAPQISTPLSGDHPLTRVSVSFLYKLPI